MWVAVGTVYFAVVLIMFIWFVHSLRLSEPETARTRVAEPEWVYDGVEYLDRGVLKKKKTALAEFVGIPGCSLYYNDMPASDLDLAAYVVSRNGFANTSMEPDKYIEKTRSGEILHAN